MTAPLQPQQCPNCLRQVPLRLFLHPYRPVGRVQCPHCAQTLRYPLWVNILLIVLMAAALVLLIALSMRGLRAWILLFALAVPFALRWSTARRVRLREDRWRPHQYRRLMQIEIGALLACAAAMLAYLIFRE